MKSRDRIIPSLLGAALLAAGGVAAAPRHPSHDAAESVIADSVSQLDFNEQTHLVFMREEEKLARDVYLFLGAMYPDASTFGNIDDSEQRHTDAVRYRIEQFGLIDPSSNDNPGVFTGALYGDYFKEKYDYLTGRGSLSELDAYYVGAFIEELDMQDINTCPAIVQQINDDIDSDYDCGKVYTDNLDIQRLYESLLEGSEHHLRAYVKRIEAIEGEGTYVAQYLTQQQVDAILGR